MLNKNEFAENVWPANSALFIYVSIDCVETVRGNAFALSARGPGFKSRLQQEFKCPIFLFCCCCILLFVQNTLFVTKFCNSFCHVYLFNILNTLQDLSPSIMV